MGSQKSKPVTVIETKRLRWEQRSDASGKQFWIDHRSKQTHWKLPAGADRGEKVLLKREVVKGVVPPTPEHKKTPTASKLHVPQRKKRWEQKSGGDGTFWVDHRTRSTHWQLPPDADVQELLGGHEERVEECCEDVVELHDEVPHHVTAHAAVPCAVEGGELLAGDALLAGGALDDDSSGGIYVNGKLLDSGGALR